MALYFSKAIANFRYTEVHFAISRYTENLSWGKKDPAVKGFGLLIGQTYLILSVVCGHIDAGIPRTDCSEKLCSGFGREKTPFVLPSRLAFEPSTTRVRTSYGRFGHLVKKPFTPFRMRDCEGRDDLRLTVEIMTVQDCQQELELGL